MVQKGIPVWNCCWSLAGKGGVLRKGLGGPRNASDCSRRATGPCRSQVSMKLFRLPPPLLHWVNLSQDQELSPFLLLPFHWSQSHPASDWCSGCLGVGPGLMHLGSCAEQDVLLSFPSLGTPVSSLLVQHQSGLLRRPSLFSYCYSLVLFSLS